MMDTRQLINFVKWKIEDSEWDDKKRLVKVGWFEDSGDKAYIAAIHEYGLTGAVFRTPDGNIMGGLPIGRTAQARAKIKAWLFGKLGIRVTGRVVIPERSMIRKSADIIDPQLEQMAEASLLEYIKNIM